MMSRNHTESEPSPFLTPSVSVDENQGSLSASIPLPLPESRAGWQPELTLTHTGQATSPFGRGWDMSVPSIVRSTTDHHPLYDDAPDGDTYQSSSGGELIPDLSGSDEPSARMEEGRPELRIRGSYEVVRYRHVRESGSVRIERWTDRGTGESHWRERQSDGMTRVYGKSETHRVVDPERPDRVWQWLLERRFDAKGNGEHYEYAMEDGVGVPAHSPAEAARLQRKAFARRYLKRIRYGNSKPVDPVEGVPPGENRWHYQVVFDYGDHEGPFPTAVASRPWEGRPDPRSEWSAGFEIRTWRLCRRILVFHDMKELGEDPVLTGTFEFRYHDGEPDARSGVQLREVARAGIRPGPDGEPVACPLPTTRFWYTEPNPDPELVRLGHNILPGSRPSDLFGEGVPGLLREQAGHWFFRRVCDRGVYETEQEVEAAPTDTHGLTVGDLEGHGQADLVRRTGRGAGYHKLHEDRAGWDPFRTVDRGVATADSMRGGWRDLSGNGRSDRLVEGEGELWWYGSEGHEGYGPARRQSMVSGEASGPPSVTANPGNGLYLANLSGSGQDIVEVWNGQIVYWPHLGYGRYGHRVLMEGAPVFAESGEWDRSHLRFVDLNGSGLDDLVYTGEGSVQFWINESGNAWRKSERLEGIPPVDSHHQIDILDLFGEGTPVLLSRDALPGRQVAPFRYRRLVGPVRPGQLVRIENGAGLRIEVEYDSSVSDWYRDRQEGLEWPTSSIAHRQVVRSLLFHDQVAETVQQQTWSYQDAYKDELDGRFSGFGRVVIRDSGTVAEGAVLEELRATPTLRKRWFHDGRPDRSFRLGRIWKGDPEVDAPRESTVGGLPDPDAGSVAQAMGALAGRLVREEVFEEGAAVPLTVREQVWQVDLLQPVTELWQAACRTRRTSEILRHYEGENTDPRTVQMLALHPDVYGNPRWSCRYDAPRRLPMEELPEQGTGRMSVDRIDRVHLDEEPDETGSPRPIHLGIDVASRGYTLFHGTPNGSESFDPRELEQLLEPLFAEALPAGAPDPDPSVGATLRLESHGRVFYHEESGEPTQDPLHMALPPRTHHEEQLAFTDAMLDEWYGERLTGVDLSEYGYVRRNGEWWARSSVSLWLDRTGFYLSAGSEDYRGGASSVSFDDEFRMVVRQVNAMGLETIMEPDFYAMKPAVTEDPNGSRVSFLYDGNGRVVATRYEGSEMDESGTVREVGGPVTDWVPPVPLHEWRALPDLMDRVAADPKAWLGPLSSLHLMDPFGFERGPSGGAVCTAVVMNGAPEGGGDEEDVMVSLNYSDGMGRTIQSKSLDREGDAVEVGPDGELVERSVNRRWSTSGGVRFDNKGQPIVQYEPFFSSTHRLEREEGLNRFGAATRYRYDGMGRVVRVETPDGFESRVDHQPWSVTSHDPNDTVRESFFYKSQVETGLLDGPELASIQKAEAHADTPMQSHLIPGGIPVLQVEWIDSQTAIRTRSVPDALGRMDHVQDPRTGSASMKQSYDLTGRVVMSESPDAGVRRTFHDAEGRPHLHWTAEDVCLTTRYDEAWRVVALARGAAGDPDNQVLMEEVVYGEAVPDRDEAKACNLLGRVWTQRDSSGEILYPRYDSRGNALEKRRRFALNWREELDWSREITLEEQVFRTQFSWDGVGRETARTTPDGTRQQTDYQPSGAIDRIQIQVPGETDATTILHGVEMDASGRLTRVHYGNGVESIRGYEESSGRLKRWVSRVAAGDGSSRTLQEMTFYWDPAGNLVRNDDRTREHLLGHLPASHDDRSRAFDYTYDALYRLTHATGWTHPALRDGQQGGGSTFGWHGRRHFSLNDSGALVPFERQYSYDLSGNLTRMRQTGEMAWTREMWISDHSNRSLPVDWVERTPQVDPETRFDTGGHLKHLEHLDGDLHRGVRGELLTAVIIQREDQEDDAEYYRYGHDGMRLRRISERIEHGRSVLRETLWLDGCEIRRERRSDQTVFEQTSVPVEWRGQKVAVLERVVTDSLNRSSLDEGEHRIHYQLCDHRGSVALELDDEAGLISYEEFFPYGGTAFMAGSAVRESSRKVYGYNGIEREDATGLCQIGYRSYAPWLFRWISPDPAGPVDGLNLYRYLQCSPIQRVDPNGLNSDIAQEFEENPERFRNNGMRYDATGVRYYDTYEHETHGFVGRYTGYMNKDGEFQDVDEAQQPWLNQQQLYNLSGIGMERGGEVNEAELDALLQASAAQERPEGVDAYGAVDAQATVMALEMVLGPILDRPSPGEEGGPLEPGSPESVDESSATVPSTTEENPVAVNPDRLERGNMPSISQAPDPESQETEPMETFSVKPGTIPKKTLGLIRKFHTERIQELKPQSIEMRNELHRLGGELDHLREETRQARERLDDIEARRNAIHDEVRDVERAMDDLRERSRGIRSKSVVNSELDDALGDMVRSLTEKGADKPGSFDNAWERTSSARSERSEIEDLQRERNQLGQRRQEAYNQRVQNRDLNDLRSDAYKDFRDAQGRQMRAEGRDASLRMRYREVGNELAESWRRSKFIFGDGRTARVIRKVAPVANGVGKVLGPIGIGMSAYNLATAETEGEVAQSGLDLAADAVGFIPHPGTMTFSLSYGATRMVDDATGGAISGVPASAMHWVDQSIAGIRHDRASGAGEETPPAYEMTLGWQIAGFLENRGIQL
ncbi:MAG: SpvB/TcaC N-terminal domain-containing protein [Balneolaceae bacterium]